MFKPARGRAWNQGVEAARRMCVDKAHDRSRSLDGGTRTSFPHGQISILSGSECRRIPHL